MGLHQSHPAVTARLKRARGHLNKVIDMMESGASCLNVSQQLHAVEAALRKAKGVVIADHIEHCLDHALTEKNPKRVGQHLKEFKEITKYL